MLKENQIYNINCFEGFKLLEDNSVDISFTSPPYNRKRNDKYLLYNDKLADYYSFICNFTDELLRITKGLCFINIQKNYYNKIEIFKYIGRYADKIKEIIIWEKTNPMPANGFNITNSYEFIFVLGDKSLKSNKTYTKNIITTSINPETFKEHKAVMHREVSDYIIKTFTKEGDIILDPFFGLGTTGLSCIKYNRKFIGFELSEEYCKMAEERIKNEINKH